MKAMQAPGKTKHSSNVGWAARKWWRLCFIALLLTNFSYASEQGTKNVLVMYSFANRTVSTSIEFLKSELRSHITTPVNFYVEYLETQRFEDPAYEASVAETLRRAYGAQKFDLIMVAGYPALSFEIRHRDELFPGVPIVFMDVHAGRLAGQKMWPGVTGVTLNLDVGATVDLALLLHPDTSSVAVITNTSEFERYWLAAVRSELLQHKNIKEIDLVGLPPEQLLAKVDTLPPHTIVLFQAAPLGSIQPQVGVFDLVSKIGLRLPTYCIFPTLCLDHGGIGGAELDSAEQKRTAAALGARVLSGEKPENIPIVNATKQQIMVDWRQLRRWNVAESSLPAGSVVLYRQPTFWERDKEYIVAAIAIILVQALLIVGLLRQRARKRKAEAFLRESENRFRVMADTLPSLIWMCDQNGKTTYINGRGLAFTGRDSNDADDLWTAHVHPEDLTHVLNTKTDALQRREPFSFEYRLWRSDGVYRWIFDVASPRVNGDGSFAGFIGSAIDVTDQKIAQEALEKVSGRLIEAQEKERLRIARELHDDICQRLVLLSMKLEQAQGSVKESSSKGRLEGLQQYCSEIASDVQSLSHQLHSSKLEILGLVAAVKGFCNEFANQHEVRIEFSNKEVPKHLSKEVSLSLFRVAQEALHNAVKYSGVDEFAVELKGTEREVELIVCDAGAGFDVEDAKLNRGLGLISMQERLHLVHGTLDVESKIGKGTKIIASAPILGIAHRSSGPIANDQNADAAGVA